MGEAYFITGAILAGGMSSRMGRPKESIELPDGRKLIEAVHDALAPICHRVVVVGAPDVRLDLFHIEDLRAECGPLGGIEALLASDIDDQFLICPCDLPRVTSSLLKQLIQKKSGAASVFRVEGEERARPLPARMRADVLPIVRDLLDRDERAVNALMEKIEIEVVGVSESLAPQLMNINSPEDLERLRP